MGNVVKVYTTSTKVPKYQRQQDQQRGRELLVSHNFVGRCTMRYEGMVISAVSGLALGLPTVNPLTLGDVPCAC